MTTSVQNAPQPFNNGANTTTPCTTSTQAATRRGHASSFGPSGAKHGGSWSHARASWRSTVAPASLPEPKPSSSPWTWSPTTTAAASYVPPSLPSEPDSEAPTWPSSPLGTTLFVAPASQTSRSSSNASAFETTGSSGSPAPVTAHGGASSGPSSTNASPTTLLPAAGTAGAYAAGLSDGQIAGITVGSVVAAALAGLACCVLAWKRRPRRNLEGDT